MHAVILTFPGHFFQTHLTTITLQKYYPEIDRITFILDDVERDPWSSYQQDFAASIRDLIEVPWNSLLVSEIQPINRCVAGWWRQQLVKLTLDRILPDAEWFVVDGDVIFDSRCDVRGSVPISYRCDDSTSWSKMSVNYVRDVLGTESGRLQTKPHIAVTSPVPFRHLDRGLLIDLRQHVQRRFHKDFVMCHLDWFDDQTIVADIDPPDRWVMTEWELIECFRRHVLGQELPLLEVGSGYGLDIDIVRVPQAQNLFRHSYQRDIEIGHTWFQSCGIKIDADIWLRAQHWYDYRERSHRQ